MLFSLSFTPLSSPLPRDTAHRSRCMNANRVLFTALGAIFSAALLLPAAGAEPPAGGYAVGGDGAPLIAAALDLVRGTSSYSEMAMRIYRPDWQRESEFVAWTRGREDALIRFVAPPRNAGDSTLKKGEKFWVFTPKLNRVVRLPYSMMTQNWAGSDFSYHDLSRSDQLLKHYSHSIIARRRDGEHWAYRLESIPEDGAPVVWGKIVMEIRDDFVLLEESFYDQDMRLVKQMVALETGMRGGRTIATRMRMHRLDKEDHWTEIVYRSIDYDIELPANTFTLFNLRGDGS